VEEKISRFPGTNFIGGALPAGFAIRFRVADDQSIYANVVFEESKQGANGILHGGAIAAVLDEAMGAAAFERGKLGYTVTMTYNYKTHIPLHQEIQIRAWIEKIEGRKIFAACDATLPDGRIAVNGTGIFIFSQDLWDQMCARSTDASDASKH